MSDYLAQLKMKIQKTPNPDTDKTDKSPLFPYRSPLLSVLSVAVLSMLLKSRLPRPGS
jgi:hypothetical protein